MAIDCVQIYSLSSLIEFTTVWKHYNDHLVVGNPFFLSPVIWCWKQVIILRLTTDFMPYNSGQWKSLNSLLSSLRGAQAILITTIQLTRCDTQILVSFDNWILNEAKNLYWFYNGEFFFIPVCFSRSVPVCTHVILSS